MRLKTRLCAALVLLACLAGLSACGESDDERAAHDTVSRFYEALKRSDAKGACALLSPAVANGIARVSGEGGDGCVAALREFFRRVAASDDPDYFQALPRVGVAVVDGDRATVIVRRGPQRRRVSLARAGDGWKITGSPDLR